MKNLETTTLGMGCFWCTEAVFKELKGVESVLPGYSGGESENPTYEEVSHNNTTGHVEVAQIKFDPEVISFELILEVFWRVHDPTTMNRQGNDVGVQYRSVIFYHDEEQKKIAELSKTKLEERHIFDDPIVTTIEPFKAFYEAEDYHQNYFENNPNQPYCTFVINPKVAKFRKEFKDLLK